MNTKDKTLLHGSAEVAVATATSAVDAALAVAGLPPVLTPAAGLIMQYLLSDSAATEALLMEWIQMVKDNPDVFTIEQAKRPYFKETMRVAIQAYMNARGEYKRSLLRSVYVGAVEADDTEHFPLERLIGTVSVIAEEHVRFLRSVSFLTPDRMGFLYGNDFETTKTDALIDDLVSFGIVKRVSPREPAIEFPVVSLQASVQLQLTEYGSIFISYISD